MAWWDSHCRLAMPVTFQAFSSHDHDSLTLSDLDVILTPVPQSKGQKIMDIRHLLLKISGKNGCVALRLHP